MSFLLQDSKILETLWEHGEMGLAIVNKEGQFLKVNPKFCTMLEYTEGELLLKNFQSITHPDDLFADITAAKEVQLGEKQHYIMTKRYLPKSGDCIIWAKLHVEGIRDLNGEFVFFLSQVGDFAIQKKSECPIEPIKQIEPYKELTVKQVWVFFKNNWKFLITIATIVGTISYKAVTFSDRIDELEAIIKTERMINE